MKKTLLITLLSIFLDQLCISQFKAGYIINNSNDTIPGYIKWEGSAINSSQCEFKREPDGESQVYKPGEISAFRFYDSKYFSTWELQTDNQTKKVFIEWLLKGRASLLAYSGSVPVIKYYLISEEGVLTELTNSTHVFVKDRVSYERKKQEYINTLLFNFRDCPTLDTKIKATPFKSKSLIGITKEYHELTCKTEDCIVFEEKNRDLIFEWGIYAAFLNSQWILNSELPEKVYPLKIMGYGIAVNINNLPALSPKFSAKIDFALSNSLYRYDTLNITYPLIKDDKILKITNAKIPVQLSYRFTQNKFSPYLSAGGTLNLRFAYKQYDKYLVDMITHSTYSNHYSSEISPIQFGYTAGLGFELLSSQNHRFTLGYNFEYCPRLFGTFPEDHSRIINNNINLRAYFF